VVCGFLNLVFPDDCRVCRSRLRNFSRIPVCEGCLKTPEPLLAEYYCSACRLPFLNRFPLDETGRCALCRLGLRGFDAVYSYGSYDGVLRDLVHLLKYQGIRPLAGRFGEWMALALPREERFDAVVPMPLHWLKRWQRGFNQAELLAVEIARRWNAPLRRVVRRSRATASQTGLTNAKRRANVQGAFAVRRGSQLEGQRILVVDDVVTTGATASACARVLKRAGARYVAILALARTDRRLAREDFLAPKSAAATAGKERS
jgi:ComF family protein